MIFVLNFGSDFFYFLRDFFTKNKKLKCHPEFFTLYLQICNYYTKLNLFTPQDFSKTQAKRQVGKMLKRASL
jgi:hypothetical protein